jgi:hypothetical protein
MKHKLRPGSRAPIYLSTCICLFFLQSGTQAQSRHPLKEQRIQQTLAISPNAGSTIRSEHAAFIQSALSSNEFAVALAGTSGPIYVMTNGHEIQGISEVKVHGKSVVFADKYTVLDASPNTYFVITSFYGNNEAAMLSLALQCAAQSSQPKTIEGEWKAEVRSGQWNVVSHQAYNQ